MPDAVKKRKNRVLLASETNNEVEKLYLGRAEKTISDSPYHPDSFIFPDNPDDLFQRGRDYSIYEDMLRDDQVYAAMQIKKDLVLNSGWDIVSSSEENPTDSEIIDDLRNALTEDLAVSLEDQLQEIISAYDFGFSLSEKVFTKRPDGSITFKYFKTRHPSTWTIHRDKYGNYVRYEQHGLNGSLDINPNSLVHYIANPKFQNPYGVSDLRPAFQAWFTKRHVTRWYAIYMEKAASPIPIGKYPPGLPDDEKTALLTILQRFQAKTALIAPKDMELDFISADDKGNVYSRAIDFYNMSIGRSLLIPDLLGLHGSETGGGSFALGKEHMSVFFKHIARRRQSIERMINRHIIRPIVFGNWGIIENMPVFKLRAIREEHALEASQKWLDAVKGNVWKPSDEEINHFRGIVNFPRGEVERSSPPAQNPLFPSAGIPGQDRQNEDQSGSGFQPPAGSIDDAISKGQADGNPGETPEEPQIEDTGAKSKDEYARVYPATDGNFSRKVNFKAIESSMNRFRDVLMADAMPVVSLALEDLFRQVEKKKIIKDQRAERISELKVKKLRDIKLILTRRLREAFDEGRKTAQNDLFKSSFALPLPNDKFMEVLNAEIFDYVGDYETNIRKATKIELLKAIKDGRSLGAVIDDLNERVFGKSEVSIERFARTKFTEAMNRGRHQFFSESGVVTGFQYSAILDDRVTTICRGLHNKFFKSGDEPIPPMHFNCRSVLIPITQFEQFNPTSKISGQSVNDFIDENLGEGFPKQ